MSTSTPPSSAASSKKEVMELTDSSPSAPLALYNAGVATAAGATAAAGASGSPGSARPTTVTRTPIPILPAKPAAAATAASAGSSSRGAMALGAAQHKMQSGAAAAGSSSASAYTPPRDLAVPASASALSSTTPSPISSSRLLLGLSQGAGTGAAAALPPPLFSPMSAMLAAGNTVAAADKDKAVSGFERTSKQLAAAHSAMSDVGATDAAQAKKRKQPSGSSTPAAAPPAPLTPAAPVPYSSGAQVTLALNKNALRGYGYLHSLTRWAEDIGFDAFRESLALCIGSFMDFDLLYPRVRNELEASKAAHSRDPAIAGYPRLVNRRIFWTLCEEDAAPLNLSLKEVDERWGNAIRTKAVLRFKKGDATVTARLHLQRICIQGTAATSTLNQAGNKKSAKGITHWRFVPFAGECKCGVLVRAPPRAPAEVAATLAQLYPIVYDAVKHYHDGAFTPLSTLALRLLATDAALCESALAVLGPPAAWASLRPWQLSAKEFEEAAASSKGEKRTPFYTRAAAEGAAGAATSSAAAAAASSSARSASEKLQSAALLLEFVLHDVEWHNYVLKHQVRCELIHASPITAVSSAGGVSTASALATEAVAELQIAWVPVAELSKRAEIEILARPDSEELEAQAPAPPPPPPVPASAASKHKQITIVELTDDDEEMSAVGGSSSSAEAAAAGGPKKRVPKAFSDTLARAALAQQAGGKTTSPPPRARTPAPRVPSPPPLPIPAAQTYLAPTLITPQSEFASRFRTFVHVVDVSPHDSSELMRKVTEPVCWQFLRMPNPGVLADFAAPRIGDLPHDFRDRFMLEAVATGLEKRWFRVEELVDTVMAGRFDAILDAATDTPRTVAREAQSIRWRYRPLPGSYLDARYRWMEQALSQLFHDQASEYVRAQMVEKGLRLMRRQYLYAAKPLPAAAKHRAGSGSSASTPTSSGSSPSAAAAAAAASSSAAASASTSATPAHTPGFIHYQYMFLRLGPEEMEALYPAPLKRDERSAAEQAQEEAKRRAFEASALPHASIITMHTPPPPAAVSTSASYPQKRAKTAHHSHTALSSAESGDEHKSAVRPPSRSLTPNASSPHSASSASSRMELVSEGEEIDDASAEAEESKSNPSGARLATGPRYTRKPNPPEPTASNSPFSRAPSASRSP